MCLVFCIRGWCIYEMLNKQHNFWAQYLFCTMSNLLQESVTRQLCSCLHTSRQVFLRFVPFCWNYWVSLILGDSDKKQHVLDLHESKREHIVAVKQQDKRQLLGSVSSFSLAIKSWTCRWSKWTIWYRWHFQSPFRPFLLAVTSLPTSPLQTIHRGPSVDADPQVKVPWSNSRCEHPPSLSFSLSHTFLSPTSTTSHPPSHPLMQLRVFHFLFWWKNLKRGQGEGHFTNADRRVYLAVCACALHQGDETVDSA